MEIKEMRTLVRTEIFGIKVFVRKDGRLETRFADWTLKVQLSKFTYKSTFNRRRYVLSINAGSINFSVFLDLGREIE